jgi:chromosomal replication initiation ATPase DnaA
MTWMARDCGPEASGGSHAEPVTSAALRGEFRPRGDFDELLRAACARYALAPRELVSGRKRPRVVRARSVVAYLAVVELGERGSTVAQALGVTHSTISSALDRGRAAALEDGFWCDDGRDAPKRESDDPTI